MKDLEEAIEGLGGLYCLRCKYGVNGAADAGWPCGACVLHRGGRTFFEPRQDGAGVQIRIDPKQIRALVAGCVVAGISAALADEWKALITSRDASEKFALSVADALMAAAIPGPKQ